MMIYEKIFLDALVFSAFLCAVIGVGQFFLAQSGAKKYIWALGYLLVAYFMIFARLVHGNHLPEFPHAYGPHIALIYLPALAYFLFFRYWLNTNAKASIVYHFIPAVLVFIATMPFLLESEDFKRKAVRAYYESHQHSYREILFEVGLVTNIIYAGWIVIEAQRFFTRIHVAGRSIFALAGICALISQISVAIIFYAYLRNDRVTERFGLMGLTIAACCGYFFMQRSAHISVALKDAIKDVQRGKSQLAGVNLSELDGKIRRVMVTEEAFTEFELTLPKLAQKLDLRPHQLSEYLNRIRSKKFSEFVNAYRVEKAKSILKTSEEENILEIAFSVGFNSKSAFNNAFKEVTGVSPSEFRMK